MMIEQFEYVSEEGTALLLNLGVGGYLFEGNDEVSISKYLKSSYQGIRWEYENKTVTFFEKGYKIHGRPTPDLKKVIVIYSMEHNKYRAPNNAVVYNADGSIHMKLKSPKLISELAKKHAPQRKIVNPVQLYFEKVRWVKDDNGNTVCAVTIGFNRDWREERILDPETGVFGDCISSGRR